MWEFDDEGGFVGFCWFWGVGCFGYQDEVCYGLCVVVDFFGEYFDVVVVYDVGSCDCCLGGQCVVEYVDG